MLEGLALYKIQMSWQQDDRMACTLKNNLPKLDNHGYISDFQMSHSEKSFTTAAHYSKTKKWSLSCTLISRDTVLKPEGNLNIFPGIGPRFMAPGWSCDNNMKQIWL